MEFAGGDIHRQHVSWDNGAEVWVNRGASEWKVGERTLPQYGFYARAPLPEGVIETAIERQGGATVEWSRSPGAYYYNGRDGAAYRMSRDGDGWRVLAAPESQAFTARVPWPGAEPKQATAIDESGKALRTVPLQREGGNLVLQFEAGAFGYMLK